MKKTTWAAARKSFMGYLEGTGKSLNTIQSYRSDLSGLEAFVGSDLACLEPGTLKEYLSFLRASGIRTNTRRRKVLTAQRFLKYLVGRNRLGPELAKKLPAPFKVERVPRVVPFQALKEKVLALEPGNVLQRRNRALLWTLLETGCGVAELARLRFGSFGSEGDRAFVQISSGEGRKVSVPVELVDEVDALRKETRAGAQAPAFTGFNRMGPLPGAISPRGAELLVEAHRARFGMPELTPRAFRHSRVLEWHREGVARAEIQKRLGLKTEYAFRIYAPLFGARS